MAAYKIFITLFFYYICFSVVDAINGINCETEKCYRSVNATFGELLDLIDHFNSTLLSAKIPDENNTTQIKNLLKQLEHIKNQSKQLNAQLNVLNNTLIKHEKGFNDNEKKIQEMFEKLSNITQNNQILDQLSQILNTIRKQYEDLEARTDLQKSATRICNEANDKYKKIELQVTNLTKDRDDLGKKFDDAKSRVRKINSDTKETFEETYKNRDNFEKLKLPDNVIENYVVKTERQFNNSLEYLKNNSNILKELLESAYRNFNDQIKRRVEELEKQITNIENDVNVMNQLLQKYDIIPKEDFIKSVNNETNQLIKSIRKELEELENLLKSFDLSNEDKELLRKQCVIQLKLFTEIIKNERKKIKEYEYLLAFLPKGKKLEEIESEIKIFKNTILLMQQWHNLKKQLKRLKKQRDEVLKTTCPTNSTIIT